MSFLRYKFELKPKQREKMKALLRRQVHRGMTEEIRRELIAPAPLVAGSSSVAASPAFGAMSSSSGTSFGVSTPWVPPSFTSF
jgi:hypothetical protein